MPRLSALAPSHLVARLRRSIGDERGDGPASAAVIAPVVLLLTFVIIQAGLYGHARAVASGAAQVGVEAARTMDSDGGAGQAAALSNIQQVAPGLLRGVSVSVSRGDLVTARVTADAPSLVPGFPMPRIDVVAAGPAERITQP